MIVNHNAPTTAPMPTLRELGYDLLQVSFMRRVMTIANPFACIAAFFLFASKGWLPPAVFAVMALSFVTYGSSSHDLVHRTLHISPRASDFWLSLIELTSLRSGTAYRLSHLHHHDALLASDDIEGEAAHGSLVRALICGPLMQIRLWHWAWRTHRAERTRLFAEAAGIATLLLAALAATPWTLVPATYAVLVVAGSWLFPLVTVYIPHDSCGTTPLTKTVLFRGLLARVLAFDHLYHLEHHLFPTVPHHHWPTLAARLDPYFREAGIKPFGSTR